MKKLTVAEFTYENCYLRFQHNPAGNPAHYIVLPANDKWENIRYCLEKGSGCFKFILPSKVLQNSYVTAVYEYSMAGAVPGTVLTSKTQVYGGDMIVVKRHPQPDHLHAYVPAKYWCDLDPDGGVQEPQVPPPSSAAAAAAAAGGETKEMLLLNEEQKLHALLTGGRAAATGPDQVFLPPVVVRIMKQHIQHPTDYATLTTPHPLFVCKYCHNTGKHFQALCPFVESNKRNQTAELLTKVRRITGIPKTRLRPATPEEIETGSYYLSDNNDKVVVLPLKEFEFRQQKEVPKKRKAAEREEQEKPDNRCGPLDLVFMAHQGMEEFENNYTFSFEEDLKRVDAKEEAEERAFYEQHPALKKKKNQICTHYFRGLCHKGKLECEFLHSGDVTYIAICQFFINGQCTVANCPYRHPAKNVFHNECNAYRRGFCPNGPACKYKHIKFIDPSQNERLTAAEVQLIQSFIF